MKNKRIIYWLALIPLVLALYFFSRSQSVTPNEYVAYRLQRGDILVAVKSSGMVVPRQVIDIVSPVNGMITALGADLDDTGKALNSGSRLQKGIIFAKVDNPSYAEELSLHQQNLQLAEAEVQQAQLVVNNAQETWSRLQDSTPNLDNDKSGQAGVLLKMAQVDLVVAQKKRKQAYAAERLARVKGESAFIRSPIDGIVLDRLAEIGQTVTPGTRIFVVASGLDHMQIRSTVVEADITKIRPKQKIYYTLEAEPNNRKSTEVSQIMLNAKIINNIVTYDVISEVKKNHETIMPYMTANVQFVIEERIDVFKSPVEALSWTPAEFEGERNNPEELTQRVWKLENDSVLPIAVTTGLNDGSFVEIMGEGLSSDMLIVVGRKAIKSADFGSTILRKILGN